MRWIFFNLSREERVKTEQVKGGEAGLDKAEWPRL